MTTIAMTQVEAAADTQYTAGYDKGFLSEYQSKLTGYGDVVIGSAGTLSVCNTLSQRISSVPQPDPIRFWHNTRKRMGLYSVGYAVGWAQGVLAPWLKTLVPEDEAQSFLVNIRGHVLTITVHDGKMSTTVYHENGFAAIGSGSPFAETVLEMGGTAQEAVEMAKRHDTGTGGMIHKVDIPQLAV